MAAPAYRFLIQPVDQGVASGTGTVQRGVNPKQEGIQHDVVVSGLSSAQYQGVLNYLGLINAAVVTTTVETAINALAP